MFEDCNVIKTSQFMRIFNIFEDFRFIVQLREEIEKVRPTIAVVSN